MKIPEWIKKYWSGDPAFRWFTYGLIIIPILWDVACTLVNKLIHSDPSIHFGTTILGLTVLLFMYSAAYIKHKS